MCSFGNVPVISLSTDFYIECVYFYTLKTAFEMPRLLKQYSEIYTIKTTLVLNVTSVKTLLHN